MNQPLYAPLAWYVDATAHDHVVLYPDDHFGTTRGRVELPADKRNILYHRVCEVAGQLCIAGPEGDKVGATDGIGAWLWTGTAWIKVWKQRTYGTSPCAFGPAGLCVSVEGVTDNVRIYDPLTGAFIRSLTKHIGARGIARVDEDGTIHSVDDWYGRGGFAEYVEFEDGLRIGQGALGGICAAELGGALVQLEPGSNEFIHPSLDGSQITIAAWQRDRQQAVVLRLERAELATMAPLDLSVPAVQRPLWFGFFVFGTASGLPGNCIVRVDSLFLVGVDGLVLAQYVAAEQDGTAWGLERAITTARQVHPGLPVIAYWTRGHHAGPVPSGDWIGVESYCGVDESLESFEQRIRTAVGRCKRVALIAQGYSSNASLTTNLAALVPIYARIARDCPQVEAVLVFSAGARATGWNDHPEIHPPWEQFAAGIDGTPAPIDITPATSKPIPLPPVFPTIPITRKGDLLMAAIFTDPSKEIILAKAVKPVAGTKLFTLILPSGRVYSCQPDGSSGDRDPGTEGGYEKCRIAGNVAVFAPTGDKFFVKPYVEVDGL